MALFVTSGKKFSIELSKQATEACDQIINEMGAEIHDDLIQKLSVFALYLDRIERSCDSPDETAKLIASMRLEFAGVVTAVRRISRRLLPVRMDDDSFQTCIELLCQNMIGSATGNIHFDHDGEEQKMPIYVQNHLIRIIQELIHNAFKHSSAWHVWVRLSWGPAKLRLEVEDDGTSFHRTTEFITKLRKKHNTLRMRAHVIGAFITYHQGQSGLLAVVELPLAPTQ